MSWNYIDISNGNINTITWPKILYNNDYVKLHFTATSDNGNDTDKFVIDSSPTEII